ncbi:hypothetical protein F5Y03DRAFT_393667 [Xylaria venustula]|nr:hypothetical protein F5Y03DRAFT_393667 [Xylaria venustula]
MPTHHRAKYTVSERIKRIVRNRHAHARVGNPVRLQKNLEPYLHFQVLTVLVIVASAFTALAQYPTSITDRGWLVVVYDYLIGGWIPTQPRGNSSWRPVAPSQIYTSVWTGYYRQRVGHESLTQLADPRSRATDLLLPYALRMVSPYGFIGEVRYRV